MQYTDECQTDSGGIDIVGRLSAVAVIVGQAVLVVTFLVSHNLKSAVGNDFVGIHIDAGASTTLHHINGEILMPLAVNDFAAGLTDGFCYLVVDNTQGMIGFYCCQLHVGNGNDEVVVHRHRLARDVIVVDAALGLYAIKGIGRDFEFS